MPLEAILQALDAEAASQAEAIERDAQAEITRIQSAACQRADAIRRKHLDAIQAPLKAEQARLRNRAKLRAQQMVLGTREEAISGVLEGAARCLAEFSESDTYRAFMEQLAREAVEVLGTGRQLRFRVRESDVPLMLEVIRSLELSGRAEVDPDGDSSIWNSDLGGLIATTTDERISLVNTIEMRLQRAAELYRSQIAHWIFGSQTGD